MPAMHPPKEVGGGWNHPVNSYLVKVTEQDGAEIPLYLLQLIGWDALPRVFIHKPKFPPWPGWQGRQHAGQGCQEPRPLGRGSLL